jgi:hypothetical protein
MSMKTNIKWHEFRKEVESWGDRLGMPVDKHMIDLVTTLNLLGVETTMSCEGHLNKRLPYVHFTENSLETAQNLLLDFYSFKKVNYDCFITIPFSQNFYRYRIYLDDRFYFCNLVEQEILLKSAQDEFKMYSEFLYTLFE